MPLLAGEPTCPPASTTQILVNRQSQTVDSYRATPSCPRPGPVNRGPQTTLNRESQRATTTKSHAPVLA